MGLRLNPTTFFQLDFDLTATHRGPFATMAKRKRNNAHASVSIKAKGPLTPPRDSSSTNVPSTINAVTSPEEVEIAVETLQALAEHPSLIKSKACKDLRTAVYAFKQASTTGMIAAGMTTFPHQLV